MRTSTLSAPIVLATIWSGALFGDDSKTATAPGGYRDGVAHSPLDASDPDPLVDLETTNDVPFYKIYAHGATIGLCPYYDKGVGAPKHLLLRLPVANAIREMNKLVKAMDIEFVVLDGFRECWVQARLFENLFYRGLKALGKNYNDLTVTEFLDLSFAADNIASYNKVAQTTEGWTTAMQELKESPRWTEIQTYAAAKGEDVDYIANEYLTFIANLSAAKGEKRFELDRMGFTAHGNGGAADIYPRRKSTGQWLNLGVPFDSASEASRLDWFETHTLSNYVALVATDSDLKQYNLELGVSEITKEVFDSIREERRILFNALMQVGGTPYIGEPWHCNFPHKYGGKHVNVLPELAGNSCQSWIRNVRANKELTAIWTNPIAHELARSFY